MLGTVKSYNSERGFGFIAPDGGGDDIFFHFRAMLPGFDESALTRNARLEFDTIPSSKPGKLQATRIALTAAARAATASPELAKAMTQFRDDLLRAGDSFALLLEQARAEGLDV